MEQFKSTRVKHAMTIGAIIGLSLVAFSIILYITNLTFNKGINLIQYVILFTGIYIGTKTYRDKSMGGYISYGKALGMGVLISVFVGIITTFFNFIMMRFIDPGLVEKYMAIMEDTYENSRLISEDQIEDVLEKARHAMTSVWSLPVGVLTFTFFGFIISLITSAFVKNDPNPVA